MSSKSSDKQHVPFSPILKAATAGTLVGESIITPWAHTLHSMAAEGDAVAKRKLLTHLPSAQIAMGWAQRAVGFGGMTYYGHKAFKDGGMANWGMFAGYTAFSAHGYARMFESMSHHAPFTGASGAMAAFAKLTSAGPGAAPGYLADFAANATEWGHSIVNPHPGTLRATVARAASNVSALQLLRMQRAGALFLGASAAYDYHSRRG